MLIIRVNDTMIKCDNKGTAKSKNTVEIEKFRAANCDKGKNALSRIKKCFLGVKNAFQGRGRGRKGGGEEKKGRGRAAGGGSGGEGSSPHPEVKCQ